GDPECRVVRFPVGQATYQLEHWTISEKERTEILLPLCMQADQFVHPSPIGSHGMRIAHAIREKLPDPLAQSQIKADRGLSKYLQACYLGQDGMSQLELHQRMASDGCSTVSTWLGRDRASKWDSRSM